MVFQVLHQILSDAMFRLSGRKVNSYFVPKFIKSNMSSLVRLIITIGSPKDAGFNKSGILSEFIAAATVRMPAL